MFDRERGQTKSALRPSIKFAKCLSVSNLLYVDKADRASVVNIFCMLSYFFCILFNGAKIRRVDTVFGHVFC